MKSLLSLHQLVHRSFSSSARCQIKNKVLENQKIFQADNGVPVHLKGGTVDALLYRFTMTLTVIGACYSLYHLVKASLPKKT
ncbi:cytochrome c oxidase subunit 7A2, mitochondrial-like [Protopterus annectens]|uniref:cytochrome c oxidase subunit 7A2, mitochondrial-like n=1 Tax=Protopterus annectens TaxID=7888 RepID=UPI001CFADB72|nr:cytochrome c oxidase subunit 7A2, mitochondrial-like [Protopterus annectens]